MFKISPGAAKALSILHESGYEAYIVGGCVRDMLMGNEANDFDITTSALPRETKEIFKNERTIETGLKHGTLTVVLNKENVEITTYRIDGKYLDSRHPSSVAFTRSLKEDLSRRDFTMNSLVYNHNEGVIDLFGGEQDIKNKVIRAIGNPKKRFCEDALRILRAIRFSSTLGFEIEENTKKAMLECKHLLHNISSERIATEINKFVMGKNVKNAILQNYEILGELCPEFLKMHGFNQHNKWHVYDVLEHTAVAVGNAPPILHIRLALLFHDTGKVHTFFKDENCVGHFYGHGEKSAEIVQSYLNKYKYDNFTKENVYKLVKYHDIYTEEDEILVKKRLNRMGKDFFLDLIKVQRADNSAQNPERSKATYLDALEKMVDKLSNESCFNLSSLNINGIDLINLGFEKGKRIGEILNTLLQEVIEEKLENKKEMLIKRAKELK